MLEYLRGQAASSTGTSDGTMETWIQGQDRLTYYVDKAVQKGKGRGNGPCPLPPFLWNSLLRICSELWKKKISWALCIIFRMFHIGCPVIYGNKWIANKWVRWKEQMNRLGWIASEPATGGDGLSNGTGERCEKRSFIEKLVVQKFNVVSLRYC